MEEQGNKNKGVQLITYPDSLGGDLKGLKIVLDRYFSGVIEGIHILPFYPSSGDRGFAPLTHREIDPSFGTNKDFQEISNSYDVMADVIANHVSKDSKYFKDYLENGENSKYKNFFIEAKYFARKFHKTPKNKIFRIIYLGFGQIFTFLREIDFIFHKHGVNKLVLKKIYRPRPGSPFVKFKRADGKSRYIWCTFSREQIDLNIDSQSVRKKFWKDLKHLSIDLGVKYIRLDAVAYVGKMRGTNNFLIPKTIRFIEWVSEKAHNNGLVVIPEVHHDYKTQIVVSSIKGVDYTYDFCLPFLMIHAIYTRQGKYLKNWLQIRPQNSISNLDTHDGIGIIDVKGLLPEDEVEKVSNIIYGLGGNAAMRASGKNSDNLDLYQMNSTYYSALGEDDGLYLLARAVQLFLPGIPQIYYVGMLAGVNDVELLERTGVGRDINRHNYSVEEVEEATGTYLVNELFNLCKLRNENAAFKGEFSMPDCDEDEITLQWTKGEKTLKLAVNFKINAYKIFENGEPTLNNIYNTQSGNKIV